MAQGSSLLPARRKDGSVLKAFHSLQPETFALNLLLPSFQQSRGGFLFMPDDVGPPPRTLYPSGKVHTFLVACSTSIFICTGNAAGHKSENHPPWFGISL